jgi:hypothetical protein
VQLWDLVEQVQFDANNTEDNTIMWMRMAWGEYTAKSAYKMKFEGGMISLYPKPI